MGYDDDLEPLSSGDLERITGVHRFPLSPAVLLPAAQWAWYDDVWDDAAMLQFRYKLALRTEWWESAVATEAIAAFAAWCAKFDSGEWDAPMEKLQLLYEVERVNALLRNEGNGADIWIPERDRARFLRYLTDTLDCARPATSLPEHESHA